MSGALADEVFRREMPDDMPSPKYREVLVVFALHANADGTNARPGMDTVGAKVGCHEDTATKMKRYWERKEVLEETAWPRDPATGKPMPKVYRVDLSRLQVKPSFQDSPDLSGVGVPNDRDRLSDLPGISADLPGVSGDLPDISGDLTGTVVPSDPEERPLERPLERPYERSQIFDVQQEQPNPKGAAKDEQHARALDAKVRKRFDPVKRKARPKCRSCGKYTDGLSYCRRHSKEGIAALVKQAAKEA